MHAKRSRAVTRLQARESLCCCPGPRRCKSGALFRATVAAHLSAGLVRQHRRELTVDVVDIKSPEATHAAAARRNQSRGAHEAVLHADWRTRGSGQAVPRCVRRPGALPVPVRFATCARVALRTAQGRDWGNTTRGRVAPPSSMLEDTKSARAISTCSSNAATRSYSDARSPLHQCGLCFCKTLLKISSQNEVLCR